MSANLISAARSVAIRDECGGWAVSLAAVRALAAAGGLSVREAEAELLKENIIPMRYARNVGTLGADGQAKLLLASAAVAGCGGLGGWIVELLARAGVGRLTLIDGDVFSDSNLNRQLLCTESNLGRGKAEAAAARVREINGAIETVCRPVMLAEDNAENLLGGNRVVFDALDNIPSRLLLLRTAQTLAIPVIHGAVAGWWGQISALDSWDAAMASALASMWEGRKDKGIETAAGTPGFTPAAAASIQAAAGIRMILGKQVPAGLFWLNMRELELERLPLMTEGDT